MLILPLLDLAKKSRLVVPPLPLARIVCEATLERVTRIAPALGNMSRQPTFS